MINRIETVQLPGVSSNPRRLRSVFDMVDSALLAKFVEPARELGLQLAHKRMFDAAGRHVRPN